MFRYLNEYHVFYENQYGFSPVKEQPVMHLCRIYSGSTKGNPRIHFFMFKKAFDCVNFEILFKN